MNHIVKSYDRDLEAVSYTHLVKACGLSLLSKKNGHDDKPFITHL